MDNPQLPLQPGIPSPPNPSPNPSPVNIPQSVQVVQPVQPQSVSLPPAAAPVPQAPPMATRVITPSPTGAGILINDPVFWRSPNVNRPISTVGVKVETKKESRLGGVIKLLVLVSLPVAIILGVIVLLNRYIIENAYRQARGVLVAIPMQNTEWQDLGSVFEPLVEIPIKVTTGYQTNDFLLDSGAVISSLPREWAEKIGLDLAFLPRSTFRGFGGTTSFAYRGEMAVLFGEEEVMLPVVFTEAGGTKSLLGRKGFFENYSIYFNHKDRQIEIRK